MKLYEACIDAGYSVRYVVFEHDGGLQSACRAATELLRDGENMRGIVILDAADADEIRSTHDVVTLPPPDAHLGPAVRPLETFGAGSKS